MNKRVDHSNIRQIYIGICIISTDDKDQTEIN